MRRILGVLRAGQDDGRQSRAPQPGLEQLDALVHTIRNTGLNVEVQIEGGERPLPEAVGLSAYRILQETLTNVLRHARATTAKVAITYTPTTLELRISDDGVGVTGEQRGDEGHGLAGMRERALLFGGEFTAGPANGKGYAVRVVLPL
jgi:signal transduction histidine kinase